MSADPAPLLVGVAGGTAGNVGGKASVNRAFPHDGCDNSPIVHGMEPGLPKRHIAKKLRVLAPSHTVVWLGLMPMYPSPLPPSPPRSLSLSLATLLDVFLGHVDEVYFVEQVRNGFLPASLRGPKINIQIP